MEDNIIEMAKELARAIQADVRYDALQAAKDKNDADETLQQLIGEFNLKKVAINQEIAKQDRDQEKLSELDKEVKRLFGEIMKNENMQEFNRAKTEIDTLMNTVSQILVRAVNGQDPDTIDPSACSGNCSGCSGCH